MCNENDLLERLNSLNDSQFDMVVQRSRINNVHIAGTRAQKAIALIQLVQQQPNGLEMLHNIINQVINSNSSISPNREQGNSNSRPDSNRLGLSMIIVSVIVGIVFFWQLVIPKVTNKPPTCKDYDAIGKWCPNRNDDCSRCFG